MPNEIYTAYVRFTGSPAERDGRPVRHFGPRESPSDNTCMACGEPFGVGSYSVIIPLGPGGDEEYREKCREGRPYNCVGVEVHYACATGRDTPGG